MLEQLGITALRPGPSGNEQAPNYANIDEAQANPFPELPDPLTSKDGQRVTTPGGWWHARRPEIVEDFEREIYGRVPAHVPDVTWSVAKQVDGVVGTKPVVARQLVGHVDNTAMPSIGVDIDLVLVTPAKSKGACTRDDHVPEGESAAGARRTGTAARSVDAAACARR